MEEYQSKVNSDFPEWKELERLELNGHVPKKRCQELAKIAHEWLPYDVRNFSGVFIADAPFGRYIFSFCVAIEQELIWDFPEFGEGRKYAQTEVKRDRDANPYTERARNRSWDCGYILGLYESTR